MKTTLLRAGALSCALLASTALVTPARAQSAPPAHRNLDANGVDLARGDFVMAFTEGSIGSGDAALSLVRTGIQSGSDNGHVWDNVRLWESSGGIAIYFGTQQETFSGFGASDQGNGATLSSGYVHTAADGTTIAFGKIDSNCSPSGLSCEYVPHTITTPDGKTVTLNWEPWTICSLQVPDECTDVAVRLMAISNSYGYEIDFNYASGSGAGGSGPPGSWSRRTGADFYNVVAGGGILASVTYAYPSAGVTQVTDMGGNVWRFTGGANGITGIRRPGAGSDTTTVSYSSGKVSSVTSEGVTTGYSRSVTGSTATMTVTDALSQVTTVVSNLTLDRVTSVTDPLSRTTGYTYDGDGRLTRVTAPEGNYVDYTYDARGNVTETRAVAKSGSGLPDMVTTASYDSTCSNAVACNSPNTTTDARGNVTNYSYDSTHGGVTSVLAPAPGGSGTRPETRYSYTLTSGEYRLTGVSTCATGSTASPTCVGTADESRATLAYDAYGNVTSVTRQDGTGALTATSAMTYDASGNLLTVDGPLSGTADTTRYRYNAARQRIGAISADPDGGSSLKHRAVRTTYTNGLPTAVETGNVDSQSDGDWAAMTVSQRVEQDYDANARPVVQRLTSGGTTYQLTQTSYDGLGRANCTAQRMNPSEFASLPSDACTLDTQGSYGPDRITRRTFDNAGQMTKVETGYGVSGVAADEMILTYRNNGQVETVTDAEGNKTTYVYDGLDRLSQTQYPSSTTDGVSNSGDYEQLTYATASGGTLSTPLVSSVRRRDGNSIAFSYDALGRVTTKNLPGSELDVNYAYDLLNRLTSASTSAQTLDFTWDALGRQLTEAGPLRTMTSTWDAAGRRLSVEANGQYYIGYSWLVTGEMSGLLNGGGSPVVTFAYDQQGRRTTTSAFDGTSSTRSYDAVGRLSGLALDLPSTANDVTFGYSYNPAGEIAANTRSNDAFSNTSHANSNVSTSVNGLNQLTAVGGTSFTHDSNGNVSAIGIASYSYDSENRLTGAFGKTLVYDPLGRLYEVTDGGNTRRFLYDGQTLFGEYNSSGSPTMFYEHGPGVDEPLMWYDLGASQFGTTHGDERGSVVARAGPSGTSINRYDEYGNAQGGLAGRFGYTGQAWIPQVGMYHYRARAYSPALGRFLQTDPIGFGGGMNLYAYVGNNPINFIDPRGLRKRCGLDVYSEGNTGPGKGICEEIDDTPTIIQAMDGIIPFWNLGGGTGGDSGNSNDRCQEPTNVNISGNMYFYGGALAGARFSGTLTDVSNGRSYSVTANGVGGGVGAGVYSVSGTITGFSALDRGFSIQFFSAGFIGINVDFAGIHPLGEPDKNIGTVSLGAIVAGIGTADVGFRNVSRTPQNPGGGC